MVPRKTFDEELNNLHEELIYLTNLVEEAIDKAITALVNKDIRLAEQIIADDDDIDSCELKIERQCLLIIATQQPIASDLRAVSSALKIITDLERIGDHASDIADLVIRLENTSSNTTISDISNMASNANQMLRSSIYSYLNKNSDEALAVCNTDDIVDAQFTKITMELISVMKNDTNTVDECIDLMLITKYLERIADHATNIAEWAYFNANGEHMEQIKRHYQNEDY